MNYFSSFFGEILGLFFMVYFTAILFAGVLGFRDFFTNKGRALLR